VANRRIINLRARQGAGLQGVVMTPVPSVQGTSIPLPPPTQSITELTSSLLPQQVNDFLTYPNNSEIFPNDSLWLNVYNAVDQYLETDYRVNTFSKDLTTITIDVEQSVSQLGYISGKYNVEYRFMRNHLGSWDGYKLEVHEISSDGLEARVLPVASQTQTDEAFFDYFGGTFFQLPKSDTLGELYLFKDSQTSFKIFDYVQDRFTFRESPHSIICKFTAPVTGELLVGDFVWIAQEVNPTVLDEVTIVPPKPRKDYRYIAGPNLNINTKSRTIQTTAYKAWDDLLSTNQQTSANLVNNFLSSSKLEGVQLNIDFSKFSNFVCFGSAKDRLENFRYKLKLIENYDSAIAALSTNLTGLLSSSASSSVYYSSNIVDITGKKNALLGSFDSYERYLYYESSSYYTSSYGTFYPTTWPKSGSRLQYTNYSVTSSAAEQWFEGIISSASLYDNLNDRALIRLVPAYIQNDSLNEQYSLFISMIGHYFDLIYVYVKHLSDVYRRDESLYTGFSKDIVEVVAKSLGLDFEAGNSIEELWEYALGTDESGSLVSTYGITSNDRTREIWKRVINNLPYLLRTKGTERGIRALINCYGIPSTILRIKEYGGPEPDFDTKTDYLHDRFSYAAIMGYNGATSGVPIQQVSVPWLPLSQSLKMPMTIELRAKMAPNQSKTQTLFEVPNKWQVKAFQSGSGTHIGFFLSGSAGWATASVSASIYDGAFHHIALMRMTASDASSSNQTYNLIVKRTNYQKVVATYTASLFITGSALSSSYNNSFLTTGTLWLPGSGSIDTAASYSAPYFTGSYQEFRYWTVPLQNSILDNHALAPTSFQGNLANTYTGSTSSYYDLSFRLCLGADAKKTSVPTSSYSGSFSSQHPNQYLTIFGDGTTSTTASAYNFHNLYEPVVETYSQEWPDLGANRSVGQKIRIEPTFRVSKTLYRNTKVERSVTDNQPPDSPRLGIYFSPQNETNQDIAEQFGGLSIDDYIGDPSHLSLNNYPDLESLQYEYNKKYTGKNQPQNYVRLMRHFDASLFQLIKKLVPYRANTQVGLVIEPTILQRNKVGTPLPTYEDLYYTASLQLPESIASFVQDGDSESSRQGSDYVQEATIDNKSLIQISSKTEDITEIVGYEGNQISPLDFMSLSGRANEYNHEGVDDQPSGADSLTAEIDFGISQYGRDTRVLGSQYTFFTYTTSGSGASQSRPYLITSSRYDYSEALCPVIITNKFSEKSNVGYPTYDSDVYNKHAFKLSKAPNAFTQSVVFNSVNDLQQHPFTKQYGLRLQNYTLNSITYNYAGAYLSWSLDPTIGLKVFYSSSNDYKNLPLTASCMIDAFFYDTNKHNPYVVESLKHTHDYLYEVTVEGSTSIIAASASMASMSLYFGNLQSQVVETFGLSSTFSKTFISRATNPQLGVELKLKTTLDSGEAIGNQNTIVIDKLTVKCLNYRAEIQDFHLHDSYGMRNARYDGSKLTSPDFNIPSADTIDLGPVITITPVNPNQVVPNPRTQGSPRRVGQSRR
jgi:hypothetical protein